MQRRSFLERAAAFLGLAAAPAILKAEPEPIAMSPTTTHMLWNGIDLQSITYWCDSDTGEEWLYYLKHGSLCRVPYLGGGHLLASQMLNP